MVPTSNGSQKVWVLLSIAYAASIEREVLVGSINPKPPANTSIAGQPATKIFPAVETTTRGCHTTAEQGSATAGSLPTQR